MIKSSKGKLNLEESSVWDIIKEKLHEKEWILS